MTSLNTNLNIFLENLLFLVVATSFLVFVGRLWRHSKPFSLPQPLPSSWFKTWLYIVLVVGVLFPLLAMLLWGLWWSNSRVIQALLPYLVILALQILSESVTLKRYRSCVWVTIPCLYIPYRIWQLHIGLRLLSLEGGSLWIQRLLVVLIVLWIFNYGVHLSQLPRLLRWEVHQNNKISRN